jgi:hypothetical protein
LIIDVFNHFYPKEYLDALPKPLPKMVTFLSPENPAGGKGKSITDLNYRTREMKKFLVYAQKLVDPVETYNVQTHEVRVEGDKISVRLKVI